MEGLEVGQQELADSYWHNYKYSSLLIAIGTSCTSPVSPVSPVSTSVNQCQPVGTSVSQFLSVSMTNVHHQDSVSFRSVLAVSSVSTSAYYIVH